MLFEQRLRDGIADGSITAAYRRWRRPQVLAGRRYRTGDGLVEVESIDVVDPAAIAPADARAAGYPTPDDARADLRGDAALPVYRIRFKLVDEPDPRTVLAHTDDIDADAAAAIRARLDRLDRSSPRGPWTALTLRLIAERPGIAAPVLAASIGVETQPFKRDVRKLKELGLTLSLTTGYRLSPRGAAYLGATRHLGAVDLTTGALCTYRRRR
jgi:hypothetical protein